MAPPRVPILGAAVYTGVFVAVVSNGSYQILQGLVERGWWGDRRALLFVGRAGRSLMASALAIRGMQMSGLQGDARAAAMTPPARDVNCIGFEAPLRRVFIPNFPPPAFCSVVWWSEREVRNVTREVGHLLAFANSGERKDAHSRGPSNSH